MHVLLPHPRDLRATLPAPGARLPVPRHPPEASPRTGDAPVPGRPVPAATTWVWHSRFGPIVIEVRGDEVFVNGDRVVPHAP